MKKNKKVLIYFAILVVVFLLKPEEYGLLDKEYLFLISLVYLGSVGLHFLSVDNSNWLRLDVFFLLGFTIVHFQWPIMMSVSQIFPDDYWRILVDDKLVNYTTWLSAIGGVCFLMGYHIFGKFDNLNREPLDSDFNYTNLLIVTGLSFVIFVLYAGEDFLSGSVYKTDGNSHSTLGDGISKYFALIFQIGLNVLTGLEIYKNRYKYNGNLIKWLLGFNKWYLGISLVYILLFLAIGDRGGPIFLVMSALILIGSYVRKFSFIEVLSIALLGGLIMNIISLGRSQGSGLEMFEKGLQDYEQASGYDTTLELANSVRTLNTAVSFVPDDHDYFYGSLWIADVLSPIPFAQSAYLNFRDLEWYEIDTASYITYLVYGNNPTSGEGTTIIADIYMNFGLAGIVLFMTTLGLFFRKLSHELLNPSNYVWFIVAAIISGVSLYYSRSGYLMSTRDVLWGILFYFSLVKFYKPEMKSKINSELR